MHEIIIIVISYFFGSIPFGFILTKLFLKKDIRKLGSGNIGATNVLRTGNKKIGYATLICDITKAVVPVLIIKIYFNEYIYLSALSVFIGHVFPVWLKFKGGKGVATYLGVLVCIDFIFGIIFGIIWLFTFLISKYSSLSSIIASLAMPIYSYYIGFDNYYFFIILFILIFFTHRENIKRLKNNTESKSKIY